MPKRLQIDISDESFDRLKQLKETVESSSYADVTQKSYKLLEFVYKAKAEGKTIQTVDKDGTITEIVLT